MFSLVVKYNRSCLHLPPRRTFLRTNVSLLLARYAWKFSANFVCIVVGMCVCFILSGDADRDVCSGTNDSLEKKTSCLRPSSTMLVHKNCQQYDPVLQMHLLMPVTSLPDKRLGISMRSFLRWYNTRKNGVMVYDSYCDITLVEFFILFLGDIVLVACMVLFLCVTSCWWRVFFSSI